MQNTLSPTYVLTGLGVVIALAAGGCKSNKDHRDRYQEDSSTSAPVTSGRSAPITSGGRFIANLVTQVTPPEGQPAGGTLVSISGAGFAAGVMVTFDGVPATDIALVSSSEVTCKTPPHAAGYVDVKATLPGGNYGILPQGFNYDPNAGGPAIRVADRGDPTLADQEMLELINRARRNPTAEGQRLGIDLSAYKPQAPVAINAKLSEAALKHSEDMVKRKFFDHLNPDGVNANGRVMDAGYKLHKDFGVSRTINATENIAGGSGHALNTAQKVHDALVIDKGVAGLVHRRAILGDGPTYRSREVGMAMLTKQKGPQQNLTTQEFAYTEVDRPFLMGVAFTDKNKDGIANGKKEFRAGLPVIVTDAQGNQFTAQTGTAGGFAFEVIRDGTYTLSIDGQTTQVTIKGESVKVDLKDAQIQTY